MRLSCPSPSFKTSFPPSTWAVSIDTLPAATNSTTDLCAARTLLEQQPQRQISTTRSVRYSAPPTAPYFLRVASAGCGLLPEHSPIAHGFFFEAFLVNAQRAVSCCCLSVGLIVCGAKRTSCLNIFVRISCALKTQVCLTRQSQVHLHWTHPCAVLSSL